MSRVAPGGKRRVGGAAGLLQARPGPRGGASGPRATLAARDPEVPIPTPKSPSRGPAARAAPGTPIPLIPSRDPPARRPGRRADLSLPGSGQELFW